MNKQNRSRLIDTENKLTVARGERGGGAGWKRWRGEEVKIGGYKTVMGMWTRARSQRRCNNYVRGQVGNYTYRGGITL